MFELSPLVTAARRPPDGTGRFKTVPIDPAPTTLSRVNHRASGEKQRIFGR